MRVQSSILVILALSACTAKLEWPEIQKAAMTPEKVAGKLALAMTENSLMKEVRDAVDMSALNGYDDEYLLRDAMLNPGIGVGGLPESKAAAEYPEPMRDILAAYGLESADEMEDLQIYWPYYEDWDGETMPVITYDPGNGADSNEGWLPGGEKVLVDEEMARERPVWVVNRNSDAAFTSLEMKRRQDPSWGTGGGTIVVKSTPVEPDIRTLVLRSFKAHRQFDSWLAGGSEFFVKTGAVEDFTASTPAELLLYQPSITDFMIVVRRKQVGTEIPFNAVLVSDWSQKLDNCAFMITEDDGGTITSWKCNAFVRVQSKSYGFEVDLPLNSRDDIVWRGSLTRKYIEKYSGQTVRFGDVDLVLELI